jgi:cobalt-zinc-cadmium efflux system protein
MGHAHGQANGHAKGHAHGAHHGHAHAEARQADSRRLTWVLALVVLYMGAEVVGGVLTGSLALLADAGHMLSDAAALALALFALWIARRPATMQRSFGYHRMEILAALTNGAALVAISVLIAIEAVERLRSPTEVAAPGMMAVAAGGLLVNLVGLAVIHGGRDASLNLRGAWLHVATDALGSVQALAAGALIWAYGWQWADPAASLAIAVLVVWSAWSLLRETVRVLMQWAPGHLDVEEVHGTLAAIDGVQDVHDLHVWTVTSGLDTLSAHVVARERPAAGLLHEIRDTLSRRFGIEHVTIQVEPEHHDDCGAC